MKIIIGLGNSGKKYQGTRHNAGFMVLDKLIKHPEIAPVDAELKFKKSDKFNAKICQFHREGEKIILVKPLTFMNNSGDAVAKIASFNNIHLQNLWVVSDDIDLPLGRIRVRLKGSSAGHKGLQSVINTIGDSGFPRIRIGIAQVLTRPQGTETLSKIDTADFVLSKFTKKDKKIVEKSIDQAVGILVEGIKSKSGLTAHTY